MVVEHGYIYAIGYDGCVKLGISSTDAMRRLRTMQTGNVQDLTLIAQAYVANYKLVEKALHREHKDRWIRGEWYSFSMEEAREIIAKIGEDLVAIELLEKERSSRREEQEDTLRRVMNRGTRFGEYNF